MKQCSGKFVIRMPAGLHGRLKQEALRTGKSLNQFCVAKLLRNDALPGRSAAATAQSNLISPDFLDKTVQWWQGDLVGLLLFGSAARGDATDGSDIDLLLIMRPGVKITRDLYRRWEEFCRQYAGTPDQGEISPHFVKLPASVQEAGGLWYEVALDGIVLRECDHQISRFLGSVREAMGQGRIRRRVVHGSPYWIKEFKESDA